MHNISEHVVVFDTITSPDATVLNNRCKAIAEAIASYTNWDIVGNTVYPDSEHKFSITIVPDSTATNNRALVNATFNGSIAINGTRDDIRYIFFSSPLSVHMHRSSNELVTYLCIGDSGQNAPRNIFIYAINNKGEGVLFRNAVNNTVDTIFVGSNALAAPSTMAHYATSGKGKYSVAKYVDVFSDRGGEFAELFWVYSTIAPPVHNALVNFSGTTMRLVTMNLNATNMMFAFPVSDYVSGESEPESEGE